MKTLSIIITILSQVVIYAQDVIPTPLKSLSIDFKSDKVEWVRKNFGANENMILLEFTPKGQDLKNWNEMVAHEVHITKDSLNDFYKKWADMVKSGDPKVVLAEAVKTESSIVAVYQSVAFNEYSMRRFIKSDDGVYVLAYHFRLNNFDRDRMLLWTKILSKSKLVDNPELAK